MNNYFAGDENIDLQGMRATIGRETLTRTGELVESLIHESSRRGVVSSRGEAAVEPFVGAANVRLPTDLIESFGCWLNDFAPIDELKTLLLQSQLRMRRRLREIVQVSRCEDVDSIKEFLCVDGLVRAELLIAFAPAGQTIQHLLGQWIGGRLLALRDAGSHEGPHQNANRFIESYDEFEYQLREYSFDLGVRDWDDWSEMCAFCPTTMAMEAEGLLLALASDLRHVAPVREALATLDGSDRVGSLQQKRDYDMGDPAGYDEYQLLASRRAFFSGSLPRQLLLLIPLDTLASWMEKVERDAMLSLSRKLPRDLVVSEDGHPALLAWIASTQLERFAEIGARPLHAFLDFVAASFEHHFQRAESGNLAFFFGNQYLELRAGVVARCAQLNVSAPATFTEGVGLSEQEFTAADVCERYESVCRILCVDGDGVEIDGVA